MPVTVATLNATLGFNSSPLDDGLRRAGWKIQQFGRSVQNLGDIFTQAGKSLTLGLTVPLVSLATAAVSAAVDFDSMKLGLRAVTGSAAEAERQFIKLREIAKRPGLGFEQIISAAANLQAAGLGFDITSRAILVFGNALATLGKGKKEFELVEQALYKIAASGNAVGRDMQRLVRQVPQIGQILVKEFGTANTQIIQKMGILPKVLIEKIVAGLEKLPQVLQTPKNAIENLQDSIRVTLATIGQDLMQSLMPVVERVTQALDWLTNAWQKLDPVAKHAIFTLAGTAAALGPLLLVMGAVINAIGGWVVSIGGLLAALPMVIAGVELLVATSEAWVPVLVGIVAISAVFIAALTAMTAVVVGWVAAYKDNIGGVRTATDATFGFVLKVIREDMKAIGTILRLNYAIFSTLSLDGLARISIAWETWGRTLLSILKNVALAIQGNVFFLIDNVQSYFKIGLDIITLNWKKAWTDIRDWAVHTFKDVMQVGSGLVQGMVGVVAIIGDVVANAIAQDNPMAVRAKTEEIKKNLGDVMAKAADDARKAGAEISSNFSTGMEDKFDDAKAAALGLVKNAAGEWVNAESEARKAGIAAANAFNEELKRAHKELDILKAPNMLEKLRIEFPTIKDSLLRELAGVKQETEAIKQSEEAKKRAAEKTQELNKRLDDLTLKLGNAGAAMTDLSWKVGAEVSTNLGQSVTKATSTVTQGIAGTWQRSIANLAHEMGLTITSTFRPGAVVHATGTPSHHSMKDDSGQAMAMDVAGTGAEMAQFFKATWRQFGTRIRSMLYSPLGQIRNGEYDPQIHNATTRADHYSHVHVELYANAVEHATRAEQTNKEAMAQVRTAVDQTFVSRERMVKELETLADRYIDLKRQALYAKATTEQERIAAESLGRSFATASPAAQRLIQAIAALKEKVAKNTELERFNKVLAETQGKIKDLNTGKDVHLAEVAAEFPKMSPAQQKQLADARTMLEQLNKRKQDVEAFYHEINQRMAAAQAEAITDPAERAWKEYLGQHEEVQKLLKENVTLAISFREAFQKMWALEEANKVVKLFKGLKDQLFELRQPEAIRNAIGAAGGVESWDRLTQAQKDSLYQVTQQIEAQRQLNQASDSAHEAAVSALRQLKQEAVSGSAAADPLERAWQDYLAANSQLLQAMQEDFGMAQVLRGAFEAAFDAKRVKETTDAIKEFNQEMTARLKSAQERTIDPKSEEGAWQAYAKAHGEMLDKISRDKDALASARQLFHEVFDAERIQKATEAIDEFNKTMGDRANSAQERINGSTGTMASEWDKFLSQHEGLADKLRNDAEAYAAAFEKFQQATKLEQTATLWEKLRDMLRDAKQGFEDTMDSTDHYKQMLRQLGTTYDQLTEQQKKLIQQIRRINEAKEWMNQFAEGLKGVLEQALTDLHDHGFRKFFDDIVQGFEQMLVKMAAQWAAAQLTKLVMNGLTGLMGGLTAGGGGAASAFIGDIGPSPFGGFAAAGGAVQAGSSYIVGELGPELFTPRHSGKITPNSAMAGGMIEVHHHWHISTPDANSFRRSQGQLMTDASRATTAAQRRNG